MRAEGEVPAAGDHGESALKRFADGCSAAGKIVLWGALVGWLLWRVIASFFSESVRVRPFEASKSLRDVGFTGAVLAENFRGKLEGIERSIKQWKARGANRELVSPIRGEEASLGEVKVPGTDFSLERLSDLFLTAVKRPPIEVTGTVISTRTETVASIKTSDHPALSFQLPTPQGCGVACIDTLVTRAAEGYYSERKPCGLELYYLITQRSECETAARRCAKSDPVFAHDIWGLCEMHRGNYHTAVERFRYALKLASRDGRQDLEALIDTNWGNLLTRVGDDPGAIAKYDDAIRSDTSLSRAYFNRGLAMARGGDEEAAATMYEKSIETAPDLPEGYMNRGALLYHQHKFKEAAAFLQDASEKVPRSAGIVLMLAASLQQAGEEDEALSAYERVIALDPRELTAYRSAAGLLRHCHRLAAAREVLTRALAFAGPAEQANLYGELSGLETKLREQPEELSCQVLPCRGR